MAALDGAPFLAGNNLNVPGKMELRVELPSVLAKLGWAVRFDGIPDGRFRLEAGEKRHIRLSVKPGKQFSRAEIEGATDRMLTVSLLGNGIVLGGMSYAIDPELKEPSGGARRPGQDCDDAAQQLLDCLELGGGRRVKKTRVRKVSVDIVLDDDCGCD